MNERIKQLLNQAGIYQPDRFDAIDGSNQMEKFAELIVRECAETVQDFVDHRFPASEYPVRLKRYFGVEQ
jgi:hypothetical protein